MTKTHTDKTGVNAKEFAENLNINAKPEMIKCPACKREYKYLGVETRNFCSIGCQYSDWEDK